jgi:hypothetical protein
MADKFDYLCVNRRDMITICLRRDIVRFKIGNQRFVDSIRSDWSKIVLGDTIYSSNYNTIERYTLNDVRSYRYRNTELDATKSAEVFKLLLATTREIELLNHWGKMVSGFRDFPRKDIYFANDMIIKLVDGVVSGTVVIGKSHIACTNIIGSVQYAYDILNEPILYKIESGVIRNKRSFIINIGDMLEIRIDNKLFLSLISGNGVIRTNGGYIQYTGAHYYYIDDHFHRVKLGNEWDTIFEIMQKLYNDHSKVFLHYQNGRGITYKDGARSF